MRVRGLTAVIALVAVLVVAVVVTLLVVRGGGGPLERAVGTLPAESDRIVFTDWKQARGLVEAPLRADPTDLQTFLDEAYDEDLSRLSAFEDHAVVLSEIYGIVLPEAEWEVFAQSETGAVAVLSLPEADLEALGDRLTDLGYARDGDLFTASVDDLARVSASLTPLELNLLIPDGEGLVVFSDLPDYARLTADVIAGDEESVADGVAPLVGRLESEPRAAILWAGDFACQALGLAASAPEDRTAAEQLVDEVGGLDPVSGVLLAASGDAVTAVLAFADDDQAQNNLQPRTDLAAGDAPGLGGTFGERFSIGSAERAGSEVVLELEPVQDRFFSTLAAGPLVFAGC